MTYAKKPLIGITAGEIKNKDEPWAPVTHGQSRTYIEAVVHAGGVPVVLPLVDDETVARALYERVDAILFAGGNDINPALFGEKPHATVTDVSQLRDKVEMWLMNWSLDEGRPILGICRGMELLNIARGGNVHQDIAAALPEASDHGLSTAAKDIEHVAHMLRLESASRLAHILRVESLGTNTHHQAIDKIGKRLRAVAWAEDGIIEAIEDPGHQFVIGVQSHPESMAAKAVPEWQRFFDAFIEVAKK